MLERFTSSTSVTEAALLAELRHIRATGLSIDNEERTPGMRCVAAAIFNVFGEPVAGISVSGPTSRMDDATVARFGAAVRQAAASGVGRDRGASAGLRGRIRVSAKRRQSVGLLSGKCAGQISGTKGTPQAASRARAVIRIRMRGMGRAFGWVGSG